MCCPIASNWPVMPKQCSQRYASLHRFGIAHIPVRSSVPLFSWIFWFLFFSFLNLRTAFQFPWIIFSYLNITVNFFPSSSSWSFALRKSCTRLVRVRFLFEPGSIRPTKCWFGQSTLNKKCTRILNATHQRLLLKKADGQWGSYQLKCWSFRRKSIKYGLLSTFLTYFFPSWHCLQIQRKKETLTKN